MADGAADWRSKPRPEVTPELLDQIQQWAVFKTHRIIALELGLSDDVLRKWREEDPRVGLAYKRGLAEQEQLLKGKLMEAALAGDRASAMFLLKTQHGYRETSRVEHAGSGVTVELSGPQLVPEEDEGRKRGAA